jgi:hypothetical protein
MQTIVDESTLRGKRTVATKNYLPGELILEEEPLLEVTKEQMTSYAVLHQMPYSIALVPVVYHMFKDSLSLEKQVEVLSLFGPVNNSESDRLRRALRRSARIGLILTPPDVELFVKLDSIMRRNKFGLGPDRLLYPRMSAFDHSCEGNCHWRMSRPPAVLQLRAIRPIAAGEELKFAYDPKQNLKHTHQRRQFYLEEHGFTCHCPCCDAPGDDTRQFDCFDPACKGVMMVCQPINKNITAPPDLKYTGVEYVEPHLLPCTECNRAAPAEYEQDQLELETDLPNLIQEFHFQEQDLRELGYRPGLAACYMRLQKEIVSYKLPMHHSLCLPVHRLLLSIAQCNGNGILLRSAYETVCRTHREKASRGYIAALEGLTRGPSRELLDGWRDVCDENVIRGEKVLLGVCSLPADAKAMLQQALRLLMVLQGREVCTKGCTCRDVLDAYLLKTLAQLPVPQAVRDMQVCAFCEESPLCAAMKLSRCAKCKKVMYCGAGCQKAHWKLHKKTCGVV